MRTTVHNVHNQKKGAILCIVLFILSLISFIILPPNLFNINRSYRNICNQALNADRTLLLYDIASYNNEEQFNKMATNKCEEVKTNFMNHQDLLEVVFFGNKSAESKGNYLLSYSENIGKYDIYFYLVTNYKLGNDYYSPRTQIQIDLKIYNYIYIGCDCIFAFIFVLLALFVNKSLKANNTFNHMYENMF